jgi:hypothetical protein
MERHVWQLDTQNFDVVFDLQGPVQGTSLASCCGCCLLRAVLSTTQQQQLRLEPGWVITQHDSTEPPLVKPTHRLFRLSSVSIAEATQPHPSFQNMMKRKQKHLSFNVNKIST